MVEAGDGAQDTHVPVLAARIVELLAPALDQPGATYVDGTLGLGGHAGLLLDACPQASLIGIDRDPAALDVAGERLARFGDRVRLYRAVYHELPEVLEEAGVRRVQAMCLDLGLSSLQIDRRERGFAYSVDAPLDMRMDPDSELTAQTIVNTWPAIEIARALRVHGEERFADRIARRIASAREDEPFTSSARLVTVIADAIPAAARHTGGHPAKRTFQALRIEVNEELDVLERAIPAAIKAIAVGGRVVVMSYHSLEDKIVKGFFQAGSKSSAPLGFPVELEEHKPDLKSLTKGTEVPTAAEIAENPRAASARLRAVERIKARRAA